MLEAMLRIAAGFTLGYLVATLLESYLHEHISDAPPRVVERWKRAPRILRTLFLQQMIESNYSHHMIHHVKTYRKDYITQFRSEEEKAAVDRELEATPHGVSVKRALYGAKFTPVGWAAFLAPLVPPFILIVVFLGGWVALGALVAMMLPPILSNHLHPYLHMPLARARAEAPWPISRLLGTRYLRAVARNHFLHHRHLKGNFNLLLGGDYLRGRARKPNARDLEEMVRLGIPLD